MRQNKSSVPLRLEIICVLSLLTLILVIRAYHLDADPPPGLSISTGIFTDPPQYTLFAKMFIETGDFNPLCDYRFMFFLKSSVTLLAVLIFKLFGIGLFQSNAVGLFYSFGAIFFFFLFLRKIAGQIPSILFLLLICFNYNQLFYGRLPFLEHAMCFYAFLSLVLLVYMRKWWGYVLAGISLGLAIFFGKVIGLVFLFPFVCYFVYRILLEEKSKEDTLQKKLRIPGLFILGFAVVAIFWLFFSYFPMKAQVAGYLKEQSLSLYGFPEGLTSVDNFIWKLVSFGVKSNFFPRIAVVATLGVFLLLMIIYHVSRKKSWREGFGSFNAGHVFLVTMIVAFYCSLMIWNYRPLRYQLVLLFPFYGAGAVILWMFWRKWRETKAEKTPYLFYILAYPVILATFTQFYSAFIKRFGGDFFFNESKYLMLSISAILTILVGYLIFLYKSGKLPKLKVIGKVAVVLVITGVVIDGILDYTYWAKRPTFTARDNSYDLGLILSPQAVISGPYAGEMTMQNDLNTIIHMFGVSRADPDLFKKYPITHLLLDMRNENKARDDYPEVMENAAHICTYHIGLNKVRLFRIAGHTGNGRADNYRLSIFEEALDQFKTGEAAMGNRFIQQFMTVHPDNISGNLLMAEKAEKAEYMDEAEMLFKKAVEFSPTNYDLIARLAQFYKDQYEKTGEPYFKNEALVSFEKALWFAPTVKKISEAYSQLKEE